MKHHPQGPLPVHKAQDELAKDFDDLDVQADIDTGWVRLAFGGNEIARYKPLQGFLKVHLYVPNAGADETELVLPDSARLIGALETLRNNNFFLVDHQKFADPHVDRLTLNGTARQQAELHKILLRVLAANREAIDVQN